MNQTLQFMPTILEMARAPGQAIEPINLTTGMRDYENPLQALDGWDSGNVIFEALRSDIGFVHHRPMGASLTDQERQQLTGVMRWLIQHLEAWRFEQDSEFHELGTLFVIAHYCGFDKSLWNLIPDAVGQNRDLLENLSRMAAGFHASFQAPGTMSELVWEREAVDRIMKANVDAERASSPVISAVKLSIGL